MSGRVTLATVLHVYRHGILAVADGERLLVHIWDESWYWPYDASRHVSPGERIRVWVGEEEHWTGTMMRVASIRKVRPELDPHRIYRAGDVVRGTVDASDDRGISVMLEHDQFVDFSPFDLSPKFEDWKAIAVGDAIESRVRPIGTKHPEIFLEPVRWLRSGQSA